MITDKLRDLLRFTDDQAEDDGLWFEADHAPEAYLQQEFRKLTARIEEWVPAAIVEVEHLVAGLEKIAQTPCGIPGHAVAVGCGSSIVAQKALHGLGYGEIYLLRYVDGPWDGRTQELSSYRTEWDQIPERILADVRGDTKGLYVMASKSPLSEGGPSLRRGVEYIWEPEEAEA